MKYLFLIIGLVFTLSTFGQKKEKKRDPAAKYFYKDVTTETDDYKAYFVDVVAVDKQIKYKVKIFNKTNDYLYVKPSEIVYVSDSKKLNSTDKSYGIPPNDEVSFVIDYKSTDLQVEKFNLELKGIYKASAGGPVTKVSNIVIPATANEFTAGKFTCTLKKSESTSAKVYAKYDCTYNGDAVGIINPSKCVAIMPNGTDNANSKNTRPMVLENSKSDYFTLIFLEVKGAGDLKKNPISINWNDTFRESKLVKLKSSSVEFIKDSEK